MAAGAWVFLSRKMQGIAFDEHLMMCTIVKAQQMGG